MVAGKIAELGKFLPCKRKDLSSRLTEQKPGVVLSANHPSVGQMDTRGSLGLTGHPA